MIVKAIHRSTPLANRSLKDPVLVNHLSLSFIIVFVLLLVTLHPNALKRIQRGSA